MNQLFLRSSAAVAACALLTVGALADENPAVKHLIRNANTGDVTAMVGSAQALFNADGTDANYKEAAKWYLKAAENGSVAGFTGLANCYAEGLGAPYNLQEAFKWYSKAAEKGDITAIYNLGRCYDYGYGVRPNYQEAEKYYKMAAEKGSWMAMAGLSRLYSAQRTPFADAALSADYSAQAAKAWLDSTSLDLEAPIVEALAAQGADTVIAAEAKLLPKDADTARFSGDRFYDLAELYRASDRLGNEVAHDKAIAYNAKAAAARYVFADLRIAEDCLRTNSTETAIKMLEEIYERTGSAQALNDLAKIYLAQAKEGKNTSVKLNDLCAKLLEAGDVNGATNLASYRLDQLKNNRGYMEMVEKAASLGDGASCALLGEYYAKGSFPVLGIETPVNMDLAYKYTSALLENLYPAPFDKLSLSGEYTILANMYNYGKGTFTNKTKAENNYRTALRLDANNAEAAYRLGHMLINSQSEMTEAGAAQAEARTLLGKVASGSSAFAVPAQKLLKGRTK